jgi:hypothetical protein
MMPKSMLNPSRGSVGEYYSQHAEKGMRRRRAATLIEVLKAEVDDYVEAEREQGHALVVRNSYGQMPR